MARLYPPGNLPGADDTDWLAACRHFDEEFGDHSTFLQGDLFCEAFALTQYDDHQKQPRWPSATARLVEDDSRFRAEQSKGMGCLVLLDKNQGLVGRIAPSRMKINSEWMRELVHDAHQRVLSELSGKTVGDWLKEWSTANSHSNPMIRVTARSRVIRQMVSPPINAVRRDRLTSMTSTGLDALAACVKPEGFHDVELQHKAIKEIWDSTERIRREVISLYCKENLNIGQISEFMLEIHPMSVSTVSRIIARFCEQVRERYIQLSKR